MTFLTSLSIDWVIRTVRRQAVLKLLAFVTSYRLWKLSSTWFDFVSSVGMVRSSLSYAPVVRRWSIVCCKDVNTLTKYDGPSSQRMHRHFVTFIFRFEDLKVPHLVRYGTRRTILG